jgi:hypothetical protein
METGEFVLGQSQQVLPQTSEAPKNKENLSQLAKAITGYELDDQRIVDCMIDDHQAVSRKYGLPDISQLKDRPWDYFNQIKQLLDDNNIPVILDQRTRDFFANNPNILASFFSKINTVSFNEQAVDSLGYDKNSLLIAIAHESTHALQHKYFPDMSIERMEYEAHVASLPLIAIKDKQARYDKNIFDPSIVFDSISFSVNHFNKQTSDKYFI